MRWLIPSRSDWQKWSRPSRLTAVGALLGAIGVLIGILTLIVGSTQNGDANARNDGPLFEVQGDFIVEGGVGLPSNVAVKILWEETIGDDVVIQSPEIGYIDPSSGRTAYKLFVRQPAEDLFRRKDGMRINNGFVFAFIDEARDGTLSPGVDKIIAINRKLAISYVEGDYIPDEPVSREKKASIRKELSLLPRGFSVYRTTPDGLGERVKQRVARIDLLRSEKNAVYFDSLHLEISRNLGSGGSSFAPAVFRNADGGDPEDVVQTPLGEKTFELYSHSQGSHEYAMGDHWSLCEIEPARVHHAGDGNNRCLVIHDRRGWTLRNEIGDKKAAVTCFARCED